MFAASVLFEGVRPPAGSRYWGSTSLFATRDGEVLAGGTLNWYCTPGSAPNLAGILIRITAQGWYTAVSGGVPCGGANNDATTKRALGAVLGRPAGIATDSAGRIYVAESTLHRIRRIDDEGNIALFAGTGVAGFAGDGGPAVAAQFNQPGKIVIDAKDNVFVADYGNSRVRRIAPDGTISTVAQINGVRCLAVSPTGQIYAGHGGSIFRLTEGSAPVTVASVRHNDFAMDAQGRVILSDPPFVYRMDTPSSPVVLAGALFDAGENGPAVYARTVAPNQLRMSAGGELFFSDSQGIRKLGVDGKVRTIVPGLARVEFAVEADGSIVFVSGGGIDRLDSSQARSAIVPSAVLGSRTVGEIAISPTGAVYISGYNSHQVYKVTTGGNLQVVAGTGEPGASGDGGPAIAARLENPTGLAFDSKGNLWVLVAHGTARVISPEGSIRSVALPYACTEAFSGGLDYCRFDYLAIDSRDTVYLSSNREHVIFKLPQGGQGVRLAGNGQGDFTGDGGPASAASIDGPAGIAVAANGDIFFADNSNNRIRRIQGTVPFAAQPTAFLFACSLGAPAQSKTLSLKSADGRSIPYAIFTSAPWLSVSPSTGTVGSNAITLTVTANPAGMPKGTYLARFRIASPDPAEWIEIPVTMTISGTPQQLRLSQTGLVFAGVEKAAAPPSQSFQVLNPGTGVMQWSDTASTLGGGAWLSITPSSGRTTAGQPAPSIDVRVNQAGLPPSSYYGLVTVTTPDADNSPQSAAVVLNVLSAGQSPGPLVDPAGLIFTAAPGAPDPASQNIMLANLSAQPVTFSTTLRFTDGKGWMTLGTPSGTVAAGQAANVAVQTAIAGLAAGAYRGEVQFTFQPGNVVRRVAVLLVLSSGGGTAKANAADAACPQKLLPVFRAPVADIQVTAGWPTPIEVQVVDDCGKAMDKGAVIASFSSTNDPPVVLSALGAGRWGGTWAPRAGSSRPLTVTVAAESTEPPLRGTVQTTVSAKDNPDQPQVSNGGILNAASFRKDAPLAAGAYISIFGSKLARQLAMAEGLPLPSQLGETTALVAGLLIPLHFTSDGQVNAILPYGIAENTMHQLILRRGASYSVPQPVLVTASEPAVFSMNGSGQGQGNVFVATAEGAVLADSARPAKPGDVVVIYATGLGPVTPEVPAGTAAPSSPPSTTRNEIKVTIGGLDARVLFAGLAPGFAGVYQVNAVIPEGLEADASVPLVISVGTQSSSMPVTIAVVGSQ